MPPPSTASSTASKRSRHRWVEPFETPWSRRHRNIAVLKRKDRRDRQEHRKVPSHFESRASRVLEYVRSRCQLRLSEACPELRGVLRLLSCVEHRPDGAVGSNDATSFAMFVAFLAIFAVKRAMSAVPSHVKSRCPASMQRPSAFISRPALQCVPDCRSGWRACDNRRDK